MISSQNDRSLAAKLWTLPIAFSLVLAGCGAATPETSTDAVDGAASQEAKGRESITNDADGEHAISASGETASYQSVDVSKTGEADGDEADFYGVNSAIYAEEGATLDLDDLTVTTAGTHANAIFSYGEGTTVNVSNSTIDTTGNCSGGIMVTGGGTLNATDLTIHTTGNSSAAIRSDRGGGTENVTGGTYTTDGMGSPVIYSTADVTVSNATLTSTSAQGVVVEGKNSVTLNDVDLTASNTSKNSDKSSFYQAVMIYQSMSGDAAQGEATFSMNGGTLDNKNGDIFFVNNTVTTINLAKAAITNEDESGVFLRAAAAGWGSEGSNGGHVTLNASGQEINGDMLVDEVSSLNLYLKDGSTFTGSINTDGTEGEVYVELAEGSTWTLTSDAHITSLTCDANAINLNGHTLYVGDDTYTEGSASSGEAIVVTVESSGGPGDMGGEPPAKPDGEGGPGGAGGEPPAKPDGDGSDKPPAKPES
ncbi:MAG: hypothetical protein J6D34_04455 [Atopobiaceae bacterium]|nr:hypothetical protein [Atopobiaceae bacterium]